MVFGPSVALLVAAGGAYAFPMQGPNAGNSTGCYKAKCRLPEPPPCPSAGEGQNKFGFSGEQTATFAQNGPLATLSPNIHWTYDTKPAVNVVPIPSSEGSEMYYGVGDPTKHGAFAFLTYYFSAPSVNLDHCDHVSEIVYDTEVLTVRFATEQAYGFAVDTWPANDNLILIAFAKGCGDYVQGERCYFQVSDLDFSAPGLVLMANGRPSHPDDIITSGETEWGYWAPKNSPNQRPHEPVNTGAPFAWSGSPTMQAGAGSGSGGSRPVATSHVPGAQPSLTGQPGSGSGSGSGFGSGSSSGSGTGAGSGTGTGTVTGSDSGAGAGSGTGPGSGTGSGIGSSSGTGTGTGSSADPGSASGSGSSSSPESNPVEGSNSGSSSSSDTVSVPGGGSGAGSGSDSDAATGFVSGNQPNPTDSSQPPSMNPAAPSGPDGPSNPANPDQPAAPPATSGPVPSIAPDGTLNSGLSAPRVCVAPIDTRYGLPTACLGDLFDEDLDNGLTYAPLPPETLQFVLEVAPDFLEESVPGDLGIDLDLDPDDPNWRTRQRHRKRIFGGLARAFNRYVVQPIKKVYKVVQQATAIPGSINKEINWKLPNPQSANPADNTIKDPSVKQAQSPWGDAMLLKSFTATQQNLNGFMNVYCVGCGVQGNAKIAGRAKWTPLGGFIEGQVELRTDVRFVLKIGVDTEIVYSRTFTSDLLNVGLPGLSYGVVTIGPRISVGTRVELNAAAKGRLLAGAEMGLQDAHVLIDFVDPSKSTKGGWEPYFKPVFEAQGELMLSASLGLPIGIKCGLQISSWDKSVGIIDEPSIKGVAQAAATIGNSAGVFVGGFTEINGCTGISTQISWRNRLYIDIFGTRQIPLLDTNDRPLARNCIALPAAPPPAAPAAPAGPAPDPPTPGDPAAPADPISDATQQPQTPTDPVPPTDQTAPATPPPADPVAAPANDPPPATDDANLMFKNRRQAEDDVSEVAAGAQAGTSSQLSYDAEPVGNNPYFDSAGREFAMLVDPDGETMVVSCSNGNMYPVRADSPDSPDCSELWATADDVLVYDGAQRLMHYYNNTMGLLGVSRLRVEAELEAPAGSVVVFWAPYYDPQAPDEYLFVAIDPLDQVFYPVVCDYADGTASKVFLAQDPVAGVETLQSPDVVYSITGGRVSACYVLVLNQGTRQ